MPKRKFTLMELLIVVAVISILASLLIPALGKARATSRRAVCVSNMKQLTMGIMMYADSNDGSPFHNYRSIQDDFDEINIIKKGNGAWECPSDAGSWGYNYNGETPMEKHGKTTFEAQGKSYLVSGQFNAEYKYNGDDSENHQTINNIRHINNIENTALYYWSSCAPLRGNYGDADNSKGIGYKNLWHLNKASWPMGFADGHAAVITDLRAPIVRFSNGSTTSPQFIVKQD